MHHRFALVAALAALAPAPVLAGSSVARDNIDALIEAQAKANKVPAAFIHRVVKRESNYNSSAKGGSALGLMQIKHATARGMGYKGDAAGLYDPETNLRYGVAYLAGAYRAAKGDLDQAYRYYNRGYYYAAKQLGISTAVDDDVPAPSPAPAATTATGFASLFGLRTTSLATVQTASSDAAAGTPALAYATAAASTSLIEVPLPPRRPTALAGAIDGLGAPAAVESSPTRVVVSADQTTQQVTAVDPVEGPLPPRRPSAVMLVAMRAAPARKPAAAEPVQEASALAPAQ